MALLLVALMDIHFFSPKARFRNDWIHTVVGFEIVSRNGHVMVFGDFKRVVVEPARAYGWLGKHSGRLRRLQLQGLCGPGPSLAVVLQVDVSDFTWYDLVWWWLGCWWHTAMQVLSMHRTTVGGHSFRFWKKNLLSTSRIFSNPHSLTENYVGSLVGPVVGSLLGPVVGLKLGSHVGGWIALIIKL